MIYDFDSVIERRNTDSAKWNTYDRDVLPLWVADTDFRAPEPVIRAVKERLDHGIFGYGNEPAELREIVAAHQKECHNWDVSPDAVVFIPGVVRGLNLACRAVAQPGDGVLVQLPVYPPIHCVPAIHGLRRIDNLLAPDATGRYSVAFDQFEAAIDERTRLFSLCSPHNPVGRVFTGDELTRMAEICLRHDVVICSDEIHCDLLFDGRQHVPIASLDPEIEARTITLSAPSKTYNIAGLEFSEAIIPNRELRERFQAARQGLVPGVNLLGFVAAMAAYQEGGPWLREALAYMQANRDYLYDYVERWLPGMKMFRTEGTFLAWLDCRETGIPGSPGEFFLREARVALNEGATFGAGGEGFVRLNFGCARSVLVDALSRMKAALERL
jgi:cysteine-S-conjugate beta-lyase